MTKRGITVQFAKNKCSIKKDGQTIATAFLEDNMFKLNSAKQLCMMATQGDIQLWHERMGHLNFSDLKKTKQLVSGMQFQEKNSFNYDTCVACIKEKMAKSPFHASETQSTDLLQLVHSDLCGSMEEASIAKANVLYHLLMIFRVKFLFIPCRQKRMYRHVLKNLKPEWRTKLVVK